MADHFLGSLKDIERAMQKDMFSYSAQTMLRLDEMALAMVDQPLSDNDYLKVLELYGRKYDKEQRGKARTYCVMRMQQVVRAKRNEKLQKEFPNLEFSKTIDPYTAEFLKGYKNYQKYYSDTFRLNLLRLDVGLTIAMMIFLVLVMKMSFFLGWGLSMAFFFGLFFFGIYYSFPRIMDDQYDTLIQSVDPNCEVVDKYSRNNL